MRALWRHCLAPLVIAAAALLSAGPPAAAHLAAAPAHPKTTFAVSCPPGTHWDNAVQACV